MTELMKARICMVGSGLILLVANGTLVVASIEMDRHPHAPVYYLLALAGAGAGLLWTRVGAGPAVARYRLAKHQTRCPGPHASMS